MIKSFKDSDLGLMLQNTAIMTCYLSSYVFPTNVQFEMMVMVWSSEMLMGLSLVGFLKAQRVSLDSLEGFKVEWLCLR